MTERPAYSTKPGPEAERSTPAFQVVVRRSSIRPAAALKGAAAALQGGLAAATSLLADAYLFGARAALDRTERLQDELAARRTAGRPAADDLVPASLPSKD
jgi:hypothetical protein